MNTHRAMMLAFAAPFGGFDLSNKERKRSRKFACTECGKTIPPGKPGRKCKGCRDESAPLKKLTPHEWCKEHRVVHIPAPPTPDGEEPQDPLAIVYEKSVQMGHSDQIAQQIIAASERGNDPIVIDENTILCDLCSQADTPACNECDYRGLKEQRDEQQVDN